MSPKAKHDLPLPGDPKRQAVHAVRGYEYQLWHSVLAWLELADADSLFLEGAEDFDLDKPSGATAVQVKSTARPVSLASKVVSDALESYWRLRSAGQGRTVSFSLITRSSVGFEKGSPFGRKIAGLEVWQRCKHDPSLTVPLREFLRTLANLPEDLMRFIASSSTEDLRAQLILPVTFETAGPSTAQVERAVEVKLIAHGEKTGRPTSICIPVKNRLLKEVLETIRKEFRLLDRALFLQIFEEETTVNVQYERLERLLDIAERKTVHGLGSGGPAGVGGPLSFVLGSAPKFAVPPVADSALGRDLLVSEVSERLQEDRTVVVHGSVGTGKTTLAKLVVRHLPGRWCWVGLSQLKGPELLRVLQLVGAEMERDRTMMNLVLDDLDLSPTEFRRYEGYLSGLLFNACERDGRLVITSTRPLTISQQVSLGIGSAHQSAAPPLDAKETEEFALRLGCADGELANSWSKVVMLQTNGHLQLVHCWLAVLAGRGWPAVEAKSVGEVPEEIREARTEARRLLTEQLPEAQREMAYRTSVMGGPFRRQWALTLASDPPPVAHPGAALDHLIGPWLEQVGGDLYRVSPLLEDAAVQVWPAERVQSLHRVVSSSILSTSPLSVADVLAALHHAWIGRSGELLSRIAFGIVSAPRAARASIERGLFWLIYLPTSPGESLIPWDPIASSLLRVVQLRAAASIDPKAGPRIVEAWESEIRRGLQGPLAQAQRCLLAVESLIHFQIDLRPQQLLGHLADVALAEPQVAQLGAADIETAYGGWGLQPGEKVDIVPALFGFIVARCKNVRYLDELLQSLDDLPPELRQRIFSGPGNHEESVTLMIDPIWLDESRQDHPDFKGCVRAFERAMKLGQKWGSPPLIAAASRGLAIIFSEYEHDPERAIAALDDASPYMPTSSVIVDDYRAMIFFNQRRYAEALRLWEAILPRWDSSRRAEDILPVFAVRKAGIAAAYTGDWTRAATLFLRCSRLAQTSRQTEVEAGALGDAALALWHAGQPGEVVTAFRRSLETMQEMGAPEEEIGAFRVRVRVNYVLNWVMRRIGGDGIPDLVEPTPGVCSSAESSPSFKGMHPLPLEFSWVLLGRLEFLSRSGSDVFEHTRERLASSTIPVVRLFEAQLETSVAFRRREYDRLPALTRSIEAAARGANAHVQQGKQWWEILPQPAGLENQEAGLLVDRTGMLLDALIAEISKGSTITSQLEAWRNSLDTEDTSIREWLDLVREAIRWTWSEAVKGLRDEGAAASFRSVAALRVCLEESAPPDELFYAHLILLTRAPRGLSDVDSAGHLAELISRQWLEKIRVPALLRNPRSTVPAIEAATTAPANGAAKAARILVAASDAVNVLVPAYVAAQLRSIATLRGGHVG